MFVLVLVTDRKGEFIYQVLPRSRDSLQFFNLKCAFIYVYKIISCAIANLTIQDSLYVFQIEFVSKQNFSKCVQFLLGFFWPSSRLHHGKGEPLVADM